MPESNIVIDSNLADCEVLNICDFSSCDDWILDSGCTFHMSFNKEWFENLTEVKNESVFMGDDDKCVVHGIGSITLRLEIGKSIKLTNVRYVPCL